MRIASRQSWWRLPATVAVLGLAIAGAWFYQTRCGCAAAMTTPGNETFDPEILRAHVIALAETIGERNVTLPANLHAAADYLAGQWQAQGYAVNRQTYRVDGVDCHNLEVTRPGTTHPSEIIVVGAHYDSVIGSPGANDNATGVAALLELSAQWTNAARTVRFVAFVNEEPPYFRTEQMGSRVYARACRQRGDDIRGMISLETMGYFSDAAGSQRFPSALFRLFYPDRGNFIGLVGNTAARRLIRQAATGFRAANDLPVECCATWGALAGIGWSDHASFWQEGWPAFMVTDTAPFRYPHYHTADDTPDQVNYPALARVTQGVFGALRELAHQ
jgi:hypothetical protein